MAENILDVSESDFESEVLQSKIPVVVDFWAVWCGPCRMIAPSLEKIAESYRGKVKIVKVNVDENPEVSAKYGIMSIPTLLFFKEGQVKENVVGVLPQDQIEEKLKKHL